MKTKHLLIFPALLFSLFIYLFFRTESTLINRLFLFTTSAEKYQLLKHQVSNSIPLCSPVVYSLPEALWVYCATILSRGFYLKIGNNKINCLYLPFAYAVMLEVLQLFHITNGYFDWTDLLLSAIFWLLACFPLNEKQHSENIAGNISGKRITFIFIYAIVYLAHVPAG